MIACTIGSKALVAADHDHALDTWRWVLRLAPGRLVRGPGGGAVP